MTAFDTGSGDLEGALEFSIGFSQRREAARKRLVFLNLVFELRFGIVSVVDGRFELHRILSFELGLDVLNGSRHVPISLFVLSDGLVERFFEFSLKLGNASFELVSPFVDQLVLFLHVTCLFGCLANVELTVFELPAQIDELDRAQRLLARDGVVQAFERCSYRGFFLREPLCKRSACHCRISDRTHGVEPSHHLCHLFRFSFLFVVLRKGRL